MTDHSTFTSCLKKQIELESQFKHCFTTDEKYQKIITMGRGLPPYPDLYKTPNKIVAGCQSIMYLHAYLENEKMRFLAFSEALISAGLAALLIKVYNDEKPEVILKCPPRFFETIGLQGSISPSRSNGLASLFLKMKQESLNFMLVSATPKLLDESGN